jgi:hypothetical protein
MSSGVPPIIPHKLRCWGGVYNFSIQLSQLGLALLHPTSCSPSFLFVRSFQFCELSLRSRRSFSLIDVLYNRQAGFRFFFDVQLIVISRPISSAIMYSKAAVVAALLALAEARFGQEGAVQSIVAALGNFGNPGQAATLAGGTPGVLLAGANACAKVSICKCQSPWNGC